ncbi:hypothetical protein GTO91_03405 [Heliobacterium undosum]|uniref:Uncharacterized protein n=1 Tax=Heliomicrobium undosum TaxID=121734 RepID=A0A845L1B6_9FIRM|nr:hypothetical protein [Heliomicrobium undosum]MZP28755.1 hypothetical protein [Heliomicrobium undosum]
MDPLIVTVLLFAVALPFLLAFVAYKRFTSPEQVAKRRYSKWEISFQELQHILKNLEVTKAVSME